MKVLHLLLFVTLLVVYSQILQYPRSQPEVLFAEFTSKCCGKQTEELYRCIKSLSQNNRTSSNILVVTLASNLLSKSKSNGDDTSAPDKTSETANTFAIRGITRYRGAQSALLSAYTEHHGYALRLWDEKNSANFQPDDPRWNKMKLLLDTMEAGSAVDGSVTSSQRVDYILMVDSDAVILDLGFDLTQVLGSLRRQEQEQEQGQEQGQGQEQAQEQEQRQDQGISRIRTAGQYPRAHVLVSADLKQGLMNSGVILTRNSAFARQFLRQWWGDQGDELSKHTEVAAATASATASTTASASATATASTTATTSSEPLGFGLGGSLADTMGGRFRGKFCDQHAFDRLYRKYVQVQALIHEYQDYQEANQMQGRQRLPPTFFGLVNALRTRRLQSRPQSPSQLPSLLPLTDTNALLSLAEYYDTLLLLQQQQENPVMLEEAVRILPMSAINSHPPAMFYQRPESQFLHLMGESDEYRGRIFTHAWEGVCRHLQNYHIRSERKANASNENALNAVLPLPSPPPLLLPLQLKCGQSLLLEQGAEVYMRQVEEKLQTLERIMATSINTADTCNDASVSCDGNVATVWAAVMTAVREVQSLAHHVCDIHLFRAHTGAAAASVASVDVLPVPQSPREALYYQLRKWYRTLGSPAWEINSTGTGTGADVLMTVVNPHLQEAQILRKRIFQLLMSYRLHLRGQLDSMVERYSRNGRFSNSHSHRSFSKGNTASEDNQRLQQQRQILIDMKYAYLGLIKAAAEAGNDYFGSSAWDYGLQAAVAKTVDGVLLKEFVGMVLGTASKAVPLHMQALMHQNLAQVYYQQWLLQVETEMNTGTDTDNKNDEWVERRLGQSSNSNSSRFLDLSRHHVKLSLTAFGEEHQLDFEQDFGLGLGGSICSSTERGTNNNNSNSNSNSNNSNNRNNNSSNINSSESAALETVHSLLLQTILHSSSSGSSTATIIAQQSNSGSALSSHSVRQPLSELDGIWNLTIVRAHRWLQPHGVTPSFGSSSGYGSGDSSDCSAMLYQVPTPTTLTSTSRPTTTSATTTATAAMSTYSLTMLVAVYYHAAVSYLNHHRSGINLSRHLDGHRYPRSTRSACTDLWQLGIARQYLARANRYQGVIDGRENRGNRNQDDHLNGTAAAAVNGAGISTGTGRVRGTCTGTSTDSDSDIVSNLDLNAAMLVYTGTLHSGFTHEELRAVGEYIDQAIRGYSRHCLTMANHHRPLDSEPAVAERRQAQNENTDENQEEEDDFDFKSVDKEDDDKGGEEEDEWEDCLPGDEDCLPFYEDEREEEEVEEKGEEDKKEGRRQGSNALDLEEAVLVGLPLQRRPAITISVAIRPETTTRSDRIISSTDDLSTTTTTANIAPVSADGDGDNQEDDDDDDDDDDALEIQQRYRRQMESRV